MADPLNYQQLPNTPMYAPSAGGGGPLGAISGALGAQVNPVMPAQFSAPQSGFAATAPMVNPASAQASLNNFSATTPTMQAASMTPAQYQAYMAQTAQAQRPGWSANNNFQFSAPTTQSAQNAYQAQLANQQYSNFGGAMGAFGSQGVGGCLLYTSDAADE